MTVLLLRDTTEGTGNTEKTNRQLCALCG